MAENSKPVIEIQIESQPVETVAKKEATSPSLGNSKMPDVTVLLDRKKLAPRNQAAESAALEVAIPPAPESVASVLIVPPPIAPQASPLVSVSTEQASSPMLSLSPKVSDDPSPRASGEPVSFRGILSLERLDFKSFQNCIKIHKKSVNMKKLDCLSYFASRFAEMAYFEARQAGSFSGVLGFGNVALVTGIRGQTILSEALPSVFELLRQGECFVGPVESLRSEDQAGFARLGFSRRAFVGAFPMGYKKAITGLWLCGSSEQVEIPPKELKALERFLSEFAI